MEVAAAAAVAAAAGPSSQAASAAAAGSKRLSKVERQDTIDKLVGQGWLAFAPHRPGFYCLGVSVSAVGAAVMRCSEMMLQRSCVRSACMGDGRRWQLRRRRREMWKGALKPPPRRGRSTSRQNNVGSGTLHVMSSRSVAQPRRSFPRLIWPRNDLSRPPTTLTLSPSHNLHHSLYHRSPRCPPRITTCLHSAARLPGAGRLPHVAGTSRADARRVGASAMRCSLRLTRACLARARACGLMWEATF